MKFVTLILNEYNIIHLSEDLLTMINIKVFSIIQKTNIDKGVAY